MMGGCKNKCIYASLTPQQVPHNKCPHNKCPDPTTSALKNGSDLFINMTNMMGSTILKEAQKIVEALRNSGVKEKEEVREIRSLGLETVKLPDK